MNTLDLRSQLRGAVYRGDAAAVLAALGAPESSDYLQLGGDGLLAAVEQGADGAAQMAREWIGALRERGWRGDAELADDLSARLAIAPSPMLRPLPVDLDELAGTLEGDPLWSGGRIDLRTGEVWPESMYDDPWKDDEDEDDDDEARWLPVESEGSRAGYRDMQDFVDTFPDGDDRGRLERAIEGRGAFRRFQEALDERPEGDVDRWRDFAEERRRGRARAWLADAGYRPASRAPR